MNVIYYPVSAILWFWHKVLGSLPGLGPDSGIVWALSVVLLVFTLRTLLYKPFVSQVRAMRKMQEFAPEIQKLKEKYGNDRQKMAVEMQKLQSQHGVNPLGGCLPILVQIPVFIGLFHVLRSFNRDFLPPEVNRQTPNYVFSAEDVQSFLDTRLFGVPLSSYITEPTELLVRYGDVSRWQIAALAVPLTIIAGILTHLTARHSVARQTETQLANPQTAIMNRVLLYLFPLGVVAGGPFFPLAILLYWLSNNLWTLAQQHVVYRRIDAEEAEKKETVLTRRQSLGPRPGQKPVRQPKKRAAESTADTADAPSDSIPDRGSETAAARETNGSGPPPPAEKPSNGAATASGGDSWSDRGHKGATTTKGSGSKGSSGSSGGLQRPRTRKKPNRKRH